MDSASTIYRVRQCSLCPENTEYYCKSCPCDMCTQCKEIHLKDLKTIDHNVMVYCDKIIYIITEEIGVRHPRKLYRKYCEPCQVPVGYHSIKHRKHRTLDIRTVYKTKRQQYIRTIHTIRSESLFYRPVLLTGIKADFKTCHTEFSLCQSQMLTKAQKLNDLIDKESKDFTDNVFCDFDFKHRCLKQKIEMSSHIVSLQRYEHIYEQSAFTLSALKFLSSLKSASSQICLTLHTSQVSMTESLNKEDVMKSLSAIQITERGNRRVENQCLLKLMSGAEFHQSLSLTGVLGNHISFVTPDRVWVSYGANLILTNTASVPLHRHRVEDFFNYEFDYNGVHTVNSESELIYIDRNDNINKLSKDLRTTTTFIEIIDSTWRPRCVYWSPSTGDLLVGMCTKKIWTGKVTRYNQSGRLTQTIEHDNTGRELYDEPYYITENNNGDVVVSDEKGVVVTDRGGRHRFTYRRTPSDWRLRPKGICTDALSHILVCDGKTKTVQMLNKDGQFLSHLLIRPSGIFRPCSLSYDVNTHRLWVGSDKTNTVVIYRYITRQDSPTDLNPATANVMESLSKIPTTETEISQQGNQCLLKLMSSPKLFFSLTVTGFDGYSHISSVTSDRVWVSRFNDLTLTNKTGATLHCVKDLCFNGKGSHTVNSESELIYIDRNDNINKLSKDMRTTTTFIERIDSTYTPRCVYSSASTGDLLVGMCTNKPRIGKVTRFNQSGRLTQTIEHDNTGLELYHRPYYITENNNGDVVVSDYKAVVVTERGGRHRFSYTGFPSEFLFCPTGICTDALSHILVCDVMELLMLNKDGQLLSHLLITPSENFHPHSLSYDVNTHHLWIGSRPLSNNMLCVYRYITRQDALTDEHTPRPEGDALCSSTSAVEWR